MAYIWYTHGMHMACLWYTHGMHMAYTWPGEIHMATWHTHGMHMAYIWRTHGIHMACLYGIHMEYTWNTQCIRSCSVMLCHSRSWMLLATGIVIHQAIVSLLRCTSTFVQGFFHALTKTQCSHHFPQITTVDTQSDGKYDFQKNSAVDKLKQPSTDPSHSASLESSSLEMTGATHALRNLRTRRCRPLLTNLAVTTRSAGVARNAERCSGIVQPEMRPWERLHQSQTVSVGCAAPLRSVKQI